MNPKKAKIEPLSCGELSLATIKEATELLSGKWKLLIVGFLLGNGKTRFGDLLRGVEGISTKILSLELQELQRMNVVSRRVLDTRPLAVEYEATELGRALKNVLMAIGNWGVEYKQHSSTK